VVVRQFSILPTAAILHVLQDQHVQVLNIGMRLKEEMAANLEILAGNTTNTVADRDLLAEYSGKLYEADAIKKLKIE
jgi:hypothetical protein